MPRVQSPAKLRVIVTGEGVGGGVGVVSTAAVSTADASAMTGAASGFPSR